MHLLSVWVIDITVDDRVPEGEVDRLGRDDISHERFQVLQPELVLRGGTPFKYLRAIVPSSERKHAETQFAFLHRLIDDGGSPEELNCSGEGAIASHYTDDLACAIVVIHECAGHQL